MLRFEVQLDTADRIVTIRPSDRITFAWLEDPEHRQEYWTGLHPIAEMFYHRSVPTHAPPTALALAIRVVLRSTWPNEEIEVEALPPTPWPEQPEEECYRLRGW